MALICLFFHVTSCKVHRKHRTKGGDLFISVPSGRALWMVTASEASSASRTARVAVRVVQKPRAATPRVELSVNAASTHRREHLRQSGCISKVLCVRWRQRTPGRGSRSSRARKSRRLLLLRGGLLGGLLHRLLRLRGRGLRSALRLRHDDYKSLVSVRRYPI